LLASKGHWKRRLGRHHANDYVSRLVWKSSGFGADSESIRLNFELVGEDLDRVLPEVAKLPAVVDGAKAAQDSIGAMIDNILGPEFEQDD
jgi:hypothetical protein